MAKKRSKTTKRSKSVPKTAGKRGGNPKQSTSKRTSKRTSRSKSVIVNSYSHVSIAPKHGDVGLPGAGPNAPPIPGAPNGPMGANGAPMPGAGAGGLSMGPGVGQPGQMGQMGPNGQMQQPGGGMGPQLGEQSTQTPCPQCQTIVQTQVSSTPGMCTYLLCVCLLPFCCCCVPFLLDPAKDVEHRCPQCGMILGKFSRLPL